MSPRTSLRKRIFAVGGPALGVVLAYSFAFYGPLQRVLTAELTKLHKLEVVAARRPNSQLYGEKLLSVEAEVQSLREQISAAKQIGSHLVSRQANLRSEFLQSTSPAMVMAETLTLLGQHGLECIASAPVAGQYPSASTAVSLKPVAALLNTPTVSGGANSDTDSIDRREMRITLRGRFQDVQSALRELQVAPLGIFTVSLEMEDSDIHTDIRIWILTIAV